MRRATKTLPFVIACLAAVVCSRPLRQFTLTAFRFPLVVLQSLVSTVGRLPQLPALVRENETLRKELTASQLTLVQLREAVRHLTNVQQLVQLSGDATFITASIVGRTILPTQHMVILDRGERHGIMVDSVVLDASGLMGRVVDVYPTTSVVMLVTDPESRVACVLERSRESGLLVGTGEHRCRLIYLDLEADVVVNDRVVTAGLEGPFPKGVLVGTVVKVVHDERTAQTVAWVRPSVKLNQLEEVACLLPRKPSVP